MNVHCCLAGNRIKILLRVMAAAAVVTAYAAPWEFDTHFSTAEGYSADLLALNGQPANHPVWSASGGFMVHGAKAVAIPGLEGDASNALLTEPIPLAPGETVAITIEFQFSGLDLEDSERAEKGIHGPGVSFGSTPGVLFPTDMSISLGHFGWAQSDYTVRVNPGGLPANFSSGELGSPEDRLRYVIELTKGTTASEWMYAVTLTNLNTGFEVVNTAGGPLQTSLEFFKSPHFFMALGRGAGQGAGGPAFVHFYGVQIQKRAAAE